jgi:hypothetical protein
MTGLKLLQPEKQLPPESPKVERPKKVVYGAFLPWAEVNQLFPKYATVTVVDWDTRLRFKVQRRGGFRHADVQPLSAEDTAVMKNVYQGHWSWRRRAVMVETVDGLKIAGSMNGMPHGQGAVQKNNFDGHFCIHFRDSKTHGGNRVDLAHQMMIWKAAGVFSKQVEQLDQKRCIEVFFTAVHQGDLELAGRMAARKSQNHILSAFKNTESVIIESIELLEESTDNKYKVRLLTREKGVSRQVRQSILITVHGTGEGSLIQFQTTAGSSEVK